jgi:hypothetical protein
MRENLGNPVKFGEKVMLIHEFSGNILSSEGDKLLLAPYVS